MDAWLHPIDVESVSVCLNISYFVFAYKIFKKQKQKKKTKKQKKTQKKNNNKKTKTKKKKTILVCWP